MADRDDFREVLDDHDDADLGMSAYLQARTVAEETVVRAAFDDLRARVRADVKAPPARVLEIRSRRRQVRAARRRVAVATAAAAVLVGGAVLVVQNRPGGDASPSIVASRPEPSRTVVMPGPSTSVATPDAVTSSPSAATSTRTGTATARPSRTRTQPATTRTSTPTSSTTPPAPATAGPTTEVMVYLWQGSLYPTCLNQFPVKRTVDGTFGWATAVSATLAGTTDAEKAAGYVSPFGPGVQVTVDEATHTVNFASTSAFDKVPPLCRPSLEALVSQTAATVGHSADVQLRGSSLLWTNWRIGLI